MTARPRWRCNDCGELFSAWAAAERHADATGHHRLELLLGRYWPTEKAVELLHSDEAHSSFTEKGSA